MDKVDLNSELTRFTTSDFQDPRQVMPCLRAGLTALHILNEEELAPATFVDSYTMLRRSFSHLVQFDELQVGDERTQVVKQLARVVLQLGTHIPAPRKNEEPLPRADIDRILRGCQLYLPQTDEQCQATKDFIARFQGLPRFTDRIAQLELSEADEQRYFGGLEDPNSLEVPNIPVLVNGFPYDYATLIRVCKREGNLLIEPKSGYKFTISQIQPAPLVRDQIETAIARADEAQPGGLQGRLERAISRGDLEYVQRFVLEHKTEAELFNRPAVPGNGLVPLVNALRLGEVPMLRGLLQVQGIDLTVRHQGMNLLMLASQLGHLEAVALLRDRFDINEQNEAGKTALIIALEAGHTAVAIELIRNKTNLVLADKCGQTALSLARRMGDEVILSRMASVVRHQFPGAVHTNNIALVREYIGFFGNDPRAFFYEGDSYRAEYGAAVWQDDHWHQHGWPRSARFHAVLDAAVGGHTDVVVALCGVKAIDMAAVVSQHGWTPMHSAARNGDLLMVQALLRRTDADPDVADHDFGLTPFMLAVENGHAHVARLLLESGRVNVGRRNRKQRDALYMAMREAARRPQEPQFVEMERMIKTALRIGA